VGEERLLWPQPRRTAWEGIAELALQRASGAAAVGFHVADHRSDGAAPPSRFSAEVMPHRWPEMKTSAGVTPWPR